MLRVAVTTRTLFDMRKEHAIFEQQGGSAFDAFMRENEDTPLPPGPAMHLVRKLLALNTPGLPRPDKVEVILLSSNSVAASIRGMKSIQHYKLPMEPAGFTTGANRYKYAAAFQVQLFLTANAKEARAALDAGIAAATLLPESKNSDEHADIRIAFDGDAVIFSDEAEKVHRMLGLTEFHRSEKANADVPLGDGPLLPFLKELSALRMAGAPIRIALVTARGIPAHERALRTLRAWDIEIDEAFLVAGAPKGPFLAAFGADMFFDDTSKNIENTKDYVASGHVPAGVMNEPGSPH